MSVVEIPEWFTPEVVDKAEKILLKKGWMQGQSRGAHGEVCLGQALQEASGQDFWGGPASGITETVLRMYNEGDYFGIGPWNDKKGRTLEEVLDFYDELREFVS